MKHFFPVLFFLIFLYSCESEFKPVQFDVVEIDSSFDAEITAIYDKAITNDELSKTMNFKIEETIITTLSDVTKKTNLESVLKDFDREYTEYKEQSSDSLSGPWELHIETEKIYQSEEIITIAISTYEFRGGAHGNDKIKFLNLDAKTGAILNNDDIIKNVKEFEKVAEVHFIKSLEVPKEQVKIEDFFYGKPFQLPENIGFSEDGIVLLYNVYEVASYNQGYTEFVIPLNDVQSLLKIN